MRKTVQNIGLLVIVIALSAVFLLEFGNRQSQGCVAEGGAKYAAKVYGDTITLGEMKAAYIMANGTRYTTQAAREMRLKSVDKKRRQQRVDDLMVESLPGQP